MRSLIPLGTVAVSVLLATGLAVIATATDYQGPNLLGETVTIAGPWLTADKTNFGKVIAHFEKATGATVDYAGSDSFSSKS